MWDGLSGRANPLSVLFSHQRELIVRRKYLVLLAAGAPLVTLAGPSVTGGCGCGGAETADAADAGVDRVLKDAPIDSSDAGLDAEAGSCPGHDGYILDDAYDTQCGFCYASASQYLPPPIQWEPCSGNAFPSGVACQQMKRTWPVSTWITGQYFEGATKGYVDGNGRAVLAFAMAPDTIFQQVVAEADGNVLSSLIELHPDLCNTVTHDARDGYYALRVYDAEANNWGAGGTSPFGGGSIGGAVTDLRPRVYTHYHKGDLYSRDYVASKLGLVEGELSAGGTFRLYDWTTGISQTIYQGNSEGMDINDPAPAANAIFFDAELSDALLKEQVWTPDGGVNDIVAFGNDKSQGAGPLNSDGIDMVWSYGAGRDGSTGPYPTVFIMTSPFATRASDLQARRLRSEGPCIGTKTEEFVVGCGYAAHPTCASLPSTGILIVRLSDGRSWPLVSNPTSTSWAYVAPLAITCDELFATVAERVSNASVANIVRVRLDSLGPGLPPD